jgi:hypothetical protein
MGWVIAVLAASAPVVPAQIPAGTQIGLARYLQGGYRGSTSGLALIRARGHFS